MRLGCIGIGSNAIRLLVASWKDGQLCDVRRERRGTRLFAGLIGGRLTEESIQSSVNAVDELAQCARGDGAQEIFVFATSAVRDAANGRAFTDRCEAACGARVEIVSGEEEAVLSYIGASDGGVCGMIDIGGGSTELVAYDGGRISSGCSLPMGSLSLYTRYVAGLFPTREERRAIREQVEAELERARTAKVRCRHLTGVGGTIRAAAKLCNDLAGTDPDNRIIPAGELQTLYKGLKKGDRDTLRQILRSAPDRVHTILPGLIILNAVMKSYGVETVSVSACGVREGYLMNRVMGVTQHD